MLPFAIIPILIVKGFLCDEVPIEPVNPLAQGQAYADLGQHDDAWRCVNEGLMILERTKETWAEAEVCRIAGEIALMSPPHDTPVRSSLRLGDLLGGAGNPLRLAP